MSSLFHFVLQMFDFLCFDFWVASSDVLCNFVALCLWVGHSMDRPRVPKANSGKAESGEWFIGREEAREIRLLP